MLSRMVIFVVLWCGFTFLLGCGEESARDVRVSNPVPSTPTAKGAVSAASDKEEPTDEDLAAFGLQREQYEKMRRYMNEGMTRDEVDELLKSFVGAGLPDDATNVWGVSLSFFTRETEITFSAEKTSMRQFLRSADRLPSELMEGMHPESTLQHTRSPLWEPSDLTNSRGGITNWTEGSMDTWCDFIVGKRPNTSLEGFYLRVLEERSWTTNRPLTTPREAREALGSALDFGVYKD